MSLPDLVSQLANGLAQASTLFLLASGLSLIFGVTRVVNFAHGSLYMIGTYAGIWLVERLGGGALGFWSAVGLAALSVAVAGTLVEVLLLRRIYHAPELFQLLATFAVVLIVKDAALLAWGPEDLLGPRAPGLSDAVEFGALVIPEYDLFLIAVGPVVLFALHRLLQGTRWGTLVRAATEDREMIGALGVNERWLFTGVFALGSLLAGLAGALQMPREPASLGLDLVAITDAFVVVVVGGLGSLRGAFYAALLIGIVKAACFALGTVDLPVGAVNFSKLTLVVEFLLMAVTLAVRPWGLGGKPPQHGNAGSAVRVEFVRVPSRRHWPAMLAVLGAVCALPAFVDEYALVLATDCIVFALFAVSLHLLMGPGGMASFGHAAYFGVGAYCAGLLLKLAGWPMAAALLAAPVAAAAFALLFGWFSVRLTGVYLAMLTLAFSQIVWSVTFQWEEFTGGSNGIVGVWPAAWAADKTRFFWLATALCGLAIVIVWRVASAPFGFSLRAARDAPRRAEAIGIRVAHTQWLAFPVAGAAAGLAGALYAFSKGSIAPDVMAIARSVDGLVMVLLGGLHTLTGPVVGAVAFTWLQDEILRRTEYWRLILGLAVLALVLLFPHGIVGSIGRSIRGERG